MDTFEGMPAKWQGEFDAVLHFEAAVSILAADLHVRSRIHQVLGAHDLTMSQWTIMTILYFSDDGKLPVGVLAGQLGVHSSTVSNAIDKLEPRDWIVRSSLDRRTILVGLTEAGSKHLRGVQEALAEANFGFEAMSTKQLRAVVAALKPVTPKLGDG